MAVDGADGFHAFGLALIFSLIAGACVVALLATPALWLLRRFGVAGPGSAFAFALLLLIASALPSPDKEYGIFVVYTLCSVAVFICLTYTNMFSNQRLERP